jgi:hypothetical protein
VNEYEIEKDQGQKDIFFEKRSSGMTFEFRSYHFRNEKNDNEEKSLGKWIEKKEKRFSRHDCWLTKKI